MCSDVISAVNKCMIIIILRQIPFPTPLLRCFVIKYPCWIASVSSAGESCGCYGRVVYATGFRSRPLVRYLSLKSVPTKGPVRRFNECLFPENIVNLDGGGDGVAGCSLGADSGKFAAPQYTPDAGGDVVVAKVKYGLLGGTSSKRLVGSADR